MKEQINKSQFRRQRSFAAAILVCLLALAAAPTCRAQYNVFLQISGISGDSTAAGYAGDIVATGFSLTLTNPGTMLTGPGVTSFSALTVTKFVDIASPTLMLRSAQGAIISSAVLYVTQPLNGSAATTFYRITLSNVVISSISASGSVPGRPAETVTLAFGSIKMDYIPINNNGSVGPTVSGCWNLQQNAPCN